MATSAEDFERAWGSHVRGGADPARPELRELVAVAEGLRSFQAAVQAPPADPAWARLSEAVDREMGVTGDVVVPLRRRAPRRRLALRVAAAAVAVFALLATVSLRATPGSFLYPLRTGLEKTALLLAPDDGSLHLHVAEARLGDLVHALRDGPQAAAPGLARALVAQRSAAKAHGASVVALDADVRSEVPPALDGVSAGIAGQVRAILGGLLPPVDEPEAGQTHEGSDSGESGSGDRGSEDSGSGSSSGHGSHESGSGDGGSGSGDGGEGAGGSVSGDGGGSGSADQTGGSESGTSGGGDTSGDGGSGTGDGGSGSDSQGGSTNTGGDGANEPADGGSGGGGTD
jgi:hypothetical protein